MVEPDSNAGGRFSNEDVGTIEVDGVGGRLAVRPGAFGGWRGRTDRFHLQPPEGLAIRQTAAGARWSLDWLSPTTSDAECEPTCSTSSRIPPLGTAT